MLFSFLDKDFPFITPNESSSSLSSPKTKEIEFRELKMPNSKMDWQMGEVD